MALSVDRFDEQLQQLLLTAAVREYVHVDKYQNGLVTRGTDEVRRVGFGVSANMHFFELALEDGCDALVVHHGLFLQGPHLDRLTNDRLHFLIRNGLTLWGAHYALDAHAELSHGAQILQSLGVKSHDPFFFKDAPWGRVGTLEQARSFADIVEAMRGDLSPSTITYNFGPDAVSRIATVTGGGAPDIDTLLQAKEDGVDLYITGEVSEWHRDLFREAQMNFIAGGHYHTESYGLRALQPLVGEWGVETTWIDYQNDV